MSDAIIGTVLCTITVVGIWIFCRAIYIGIDDPRREHAWSDTHSAVVAELGRAGVATHQRPRSMGPATLREEHRVRELKGPGLGLNPTLMDFDGTSSSIDGVIFA